MRSEEQIYEAISTERDRQRTLGYSELHDDLHSLTEWGDYMGRYLPGPFSDLSMAKESTTKLAAMCVALLESIERREVRAAGAQA